MAAINALPMQSAMVAVNGFQASPTVPLSRLIEFAVQRTYHELTVLADLLPRKTDMERKIEIVSFASRTRQLFVRLLALVKWAGSASKVDKCANIVNFLDRQSDLFIETADILSKMARETLVSARLPSFQLPTAVEVLTLGTYCRLPTIIRDRIVPPDPISTSEKKATLLRLNQIIQQRLVTTGLPSQMRNLKIEFGRVTFHVEHEFELSLTLMGDNPSLPWRILNIDILVEDKETGGGKDLVHPLQIMFLQGLIQSRLTDNSKPLIDAYNTLHSFCLSLQLEVLQAQAFRLCRERLEDFIRIDDYVPGNRLLISYWKETPSSKDDKCFRLCVQIDSSEPTRPLQVIHFPELGHKDSSHSFQAIKSEYFSVEKILIQTTYERAKQKLIQLKKELDEKNVGQSILSGSPSVLQISFIQPCMTSERLLVSVDTLTGHFLVHIPQFDDCPIVDEIQAVINKNTAKMIQLFHQLRVWLTRERCKKTVESLPVHVMESLPFSNTYLHPFMSLKSPKLYYRFSKHHNNCLVTVFDEDDLRHELKIDYYLLYISHTSTSNEESSTQFELELPKPYLQITKALKLDISNISHHSFLSEDSSDRNGKRKMCSINIGENKVQRTSASGYYIPELAHVVSFCEEKLAYSSLSSELHKRSICHQVLQDSDGYCHYIDIVKFSQCISCPEAYIEALQNDTLSCSIRLHGKGTKIWNVVFAFCNPQIPTLAPKEHGSRRVVILSYDYVSGSQTNISKMVDELLNDWTAISRLYGIVKNFGQNLLTNTQINNLLFDIKSFTYRKLTIGYGLSKTFVVTIYWKSAERRFQLCFGVVGQASSNSNPHVLVNTQLQHEFNQHLSVVELIHVLNYTLNPLLTIQSMSGIPLLGTVNSRPQLPVQAFSIIPQSSTHIRIIYRNIYCLDVILYHDNTIAIRDGAFSLFDKMKVMEDLTPIQGLKAFLNKFVDKTLQMRRLSQTEDDNPPSPMPQIESVESYLYSATQIKTSSPSKNESNSSTVGNRALGHAITSSAQGSNPHTPSSPHTSVLSQPGFTSSPGTFPLASPPSHGMPNPVSSSNQVAASPSMPVPDQSPANLFGVNSPMNPLHAPSPSFLPTPSPSTSTQFHSQSPVSQFIPNNPSQGGLDSAMGSPFGAPNIGSSNISMPSPAPNAWPGSPSLPRPSPRSIGPSQSPGLNQTHLLSNIASPQALGANQHHTANLIHNASGNPLSARMLPQRPWAAALPTLLTPQGFDIMCRTNLNMENMQSMPNSNSVYFSLSQLERFLGCVFIRRHLQRVISNDDNFKVVHTAEAGVIQFTSETMLFKISLDTNSMQSLHLKITPLPEFHHWSREELEVLQQFFETKVVCAPFKPNGFLAYVRILNAPIKILKDCIQLMRLELFPDRSLKWSIQWCLTIPPAGPPIGPPGMSACYMFKNKMLIFLQFTRMPIPGHPMAAEPTTLIVPFIYDMSTNSIQVAGFGRDSTYTQSTALNLINSMLKRLVEFGGESNIYMAVRDVMANLQIP